MICHTYQLTSIQSKDVSVKRAMSYISSADTPLSNFHPCSFKLDMCEFNSVEQYLQSSKGEYVIAERILATNDPFKQKRLGSDAKGNIAAWTDVAKQVVNSAVKAKFMQNDGLRGYLRTTGSKMFGEASTDPD